MNLEKFENLDEDKKNKILNAAMDEFIAYGYVGASTNNIVKNAEISKGSLFNYFENKEKLFLYVFSYCMGQIPKKINSIKDIDIKNDLFYGMRFFMNTIIGHFTDNSKNFMFLAKGIISAPDHLRFQFLKKKREIQGNFVKILVDNIDKSYFRTEVKREQIEFLILTIMDTLSNRYIEEYEGDVKKLKDNTEVREKEIQSYIELIKYGIMKERESLWKNYFY